MGEEEGDVISRNLFHSYFPKYLYVLSILDTWNSPNWHICSLTLSFHSPSPSPSPFIYIFGSVSASFTITKYLQMKLIKIKINGKSSCI